MLEATKQAVWQDQHKKGSLLFKHNHNIPIAMFIKSHHNKLHET